MLYHTTIHKSLFMGRAGCSTNLVMQETRIKRILRQYSYHIISFLDQFQGGTDGLFAMLGLEFVSGVVV